MVESVGAKPITESRKVAAVARVTIAQAPEKAVSAKEAAPATTLASQLAASPPVDGARVERIKRAVAEGTFPLSPSTIADRLIALKYDWLADDAA